MIRFVLELSKIKLLNKIFDTKKGPICVMQ